MMNKNRHGLMENTAPSVAKPTTSTTQPVNTGLSLHQDSATAVRRVQKALQQSNQAHLRPPATQQSLQTKEESELNDTILATPVYSPTDDVYYEPVKVVNPDDPVTYPILHLSLQHVYNEIKHELTDEMKQFHADLNQSCETSPILLNNPHGKQQDEPIEYDLADL